MSMGDLGKDPIRSDKPQGDNVRHEDIFFDLKEEIGKMSSPSGMDSFSWDKVQEKSVIILKDHAKDLMVASYMGVALVNLNSAQGLDASTEMYWNLVNTYWDTMYPPKPKGRIAALAWWVEKTEKALADCDWTLKSSQVSTITKRLEDMAGFLSGRIEGPDFKDLLQSIRALSSNGNTKDKTPEKGAPAKGPGEVKSSPMEPLPELADVSDETADEALKRLMPLFVPIKQAAKVFREERMGNPLAYSWLRFAVWDPISVLPPSTDGVTRIPPPSAQTINHLEGLLQKQDFAALIQASESALASAKNLFVIELNYYSWTGLDKLGKACHGARDAVFFSTRSFLKRLDGIPQLCFSDKSPFVSERTGDWLSRLEDTLEGRADTSESRSENDDEAHKVINSARECLAQGGNLDDALQMLQVGLDTTRSKKQGMVLRLEFARILMKEKKDSVALAHLESVVFDVGHYHLETWEPDLALDALKYSYKVFQKQKDARFKSMAQDVLAQITRINPLAAIRL